MITATECQEHGFTHLAVSIWREAPPAGRDAQEWFLLADALDDLGDDEALSAAKTAWSLGSAAAGDLISSIYLERREADKARDFFEDAVRTGRRVPALRLLSVAQASLKLRDEALSTIREAVAAGDPEAASTLGSMLLTDGDVEQARMAFRDADRLGDWRGREGLGLVDIELGDYANAKELFASLAVAGYERGVLGLAKCYLAEGRSVMARAALEDVAWSLHEAATLLVRILDSDERDRAIRELSEAHGTGWRQHLED